MPNTGPDFINAIKENEKLKQIKDCPGVPAQMGLAVYGDWRNDEDPGIVIRGTNNWKAGSLFHTTVTNFAGMSAMPTISLNR